jgi:hypothetical protein
VATARPKAKFLTVIWGDRYVEEFARVSLPSYLAPGNLPFLAQAMELEVLILTSEKSSAAFAREPAFNALATLCPVRFIFIDDLITTGNYGVTLTLAYARGIMDSGDEQTNTCFIFMNADFVLSDGSLRTLTDKLAAGHPCVMAPSLRACAEPVFPMLAERVDRSGHRLSMPGRELVQLAFDNPHPTVIGKTITQNFVSCTTSNQIYWQVDDTTLLGRYHLIFMLAIKPERPMPPVNSYCDYGFVPELVPSGRFLVLDDSDDFFMLELQPTEQEKQFLHCGAVSLREIARELSAWTTREHRRFAKHDVIFHSRNLPPNLDTVRREAASFISRLHRAMKCKAVNHVRHYYWIFGVESWRTLRRASTELEEVSLPPECAHFYPKRVAFDLAGIAGGYLALLGGMRRLAGAPPNVPVWHHSWLDARLVRQWITSATGGSQACRGLVVCLRPSALSRFLEDSGTFDVIHGGALLDDGALAEWLKSRKGGGAGYDSILCHIYRADVRQIRPILARLSTLLRPEAKVGVYIEHEASDMDPSNFSWELAQYVQDILPPGWIGLGIQTSFVGGLSKRRLRRIEARLVRCLWPTTWRRAVALPFAALLWPLVAALTAANNWRLRHGFKSCPPFCSSALISLSGLGRSESVHRSAA